MKISVLYPSRSRPEVARETAKNWISKADNALQIEWILSLDGDDPKLLEYGRGMGLLSNSVITDGKTSCINAINKAAERCTGDLIVCISDDFDCPEHWDTLLLEALAGKSDFCVRVNDGLQKWLITLPIIDRIYYERFGYVYHPSFKHIFADTHMTAVAWMLGRYLEVDLTFRHDHHTTGRTQMDDLNRRNNATWGEGELLFKKLRRLNFELPLNQIVNKELPEISGLNIPRYR